MPKTTKLFWLTNNICIAVALLCSLYIQTAHGISRDKIIIIGTGKNIVPSLAAMQLKIEQLGKNFKDYRVFIYENNSTDKTAELLKAWAHKNNKVTVISENLSVEQLKERTKGHSVKNGAPCRMELIAYGRNQALSKALDQEFDDFKFVLVTDLDFLAGWTVKDVLKACAIKQPWDCLAANSIKLGWKGLHSDYYDRYAYRDKEFPLGPETIGSEFWRHLRKYPLIIEPGTGLKKVFSAFGGIAIYKRDALKGCQYCGYVTDDLKILLDRILNGKVSHDNPYYRTYIELIDQQTSPLPVIFRANCGYDATVACEHVTLHASMILKGHDKIYVDSDLICRY